MSDPTENPQPAEVPQPDFLDQLAKAPQSGLMNGSSKALTLLALAAILLLLMSWSIVLPVIGVLYLAGKLP